MMDERRKGRPDDTKSSAERAQAIVYVVIGYIKDLLVEETGLFDAGPGNKHASPGDDRQRQPNAQPPHRAGKAFVASNEPMTREPAEAGDHADMLNGSIWIE